MAMVHLGTMFSGAGERRVAIKRLAETDRLTPEAGERIVQEARLVFQLTHANICQALDLAENEEGTFIVMEYVDGLDLRSLLLRMADQKARLEVPIAIHIAREIARALDYAHRRADASGVSWNLVHGDVTPGNILLSREGEVKLTDFGIAQASGVSAPGNDIRAGTKGYLAPEVAENATTNSHLADIYSLGATLQVALGLGLQRGVDVERLRARRPELDEELVRVIARATAPKCQDRFASADDLEHALGLLLAQKYPTFRPSALAELVRGYANSEKLTTADEVTQTLMSLTRAAAARDGFAPAVAVLEKDGSSAPASTPNRRPLPWALGAIAVVLVTVAAWMQLHAPSPTAQTPTIRPLELAHVPDQTAKGDKTDQTDKTDVVEPTSPEKTPTPKSLSAPLPSTRSQVVRSQSHKRAIAPASAGAAVEKSEPAKRAGRVWGDVE